MCCLLVGTFAVWWQSRYAGYVLCAIIVRVLPATGNGLAPENDQQVSSWFKYIMSYVKFPLHLCACFVLPPNKYLIPE